MIRPFRLRIAYCPFFKCVKQIDINYVLFFLSNFYYGMSHALLQIRSLSFDGEILQIKKAKKKKKKKEMGPSSENLTIDS